MQIAGRAQQAARLGGYDVVMLDTAGRLTLDEALMSEAADVRRAVNPHEILLVADALTGQDAVNLARAFNERLDITGIVLTRVDGDGRGGAALSMRAVTGKPIKLIGTGEKLDAIEDFYPQRIADRILGMGDIISLVEKAAATIDAEKAARAAEKMRRGAFDLADLREQLAQMKTMGGMSGLMAMMPGIAKIKNQLAERNLDETLLKRQMAIIDSMTPAERRNPDMLKASRKRRIAAGSGTKPEDINRPAEDASHHGRRDEGDGRRQTRADGRPRQHARPGRRHAEPGADGEACGENAGRAAGGNARRARPAAEHAGPAAEFSRPAGWNAETSRRASWPSGIREKRSEMTLKTTKGS